MWEGGGFRVEKIFTRGRVSFTIRQISLPPKPSITVFRNYPHGVWTGRGIACWPRLTPWEVGMVCNAAHPRLHCPSCHSSGCDAGEVSSCVYIKFFRDSLSPHGDKHVICAFFGEILMIARPETSPGNKQHIEELCTKRLHPQKEVILSAAGGYL